MPTYRLVNGHGIPLDAFEAADDAEACVRGRELAVAFTGPAPSSSAQRPDFRVQRRGGERWEVVPAWVPRPREPTTQEAGTSVGE